MNTFNFNHLYYFYVTSKLDGVTAAAKHLHTSQSSLSMQLKTLESTLGRKLFRKSGRRMQLTEGGKEIFVYCKRAFGTFEEMTDQINRKTASMGIRVTVGVASDLDRPFIADLMAKTLLNYPTGQKPRLNLLSLPSERLEQGLKLGEIDVLVTNKIFIDQDIEILSELSLPVRAFAAEKLAKQLKGKAFGEICRSGLYGFSLPSIRTLLRNETESYFSKKRASPPILFESNVLSTVIRAAVEGLGIVVVPSAYAVNDLSSRQLFPISEHELWKHRLIAVSRRDQFDDERSMFLKHLAAELVSPHPDLPKTKKR